jgi:hypothetical protein
MMNLLGQLAQRHVPAPIRTIVLKRLCVDTAIAFDLVAPPLANLTSDEVLVTFAEFTAAAACQTGTSPLVSERLFQVACRYGRALRRAFGVKSVSDVMAAARIIYRLLGVDFAGDAGGDILVRRCSFSTRYTPEVCAVMSALDAGLLAGLSAGGQLSFSQRISAGFPCCRARLLLP